MHITNHFVIVCCNIIQCIAFNCTVIIVVFIFTSKYLYHSFKTKFIVEFISNTYINSLFLFTLSKFRTPSNPPAYLILLNVPTSSH